MLNCRASVQRLVKFYRSGSQCHFTILCRDDRIIISHKPSLNALIQEVTCVKPLIPELITMIVEEKRGREHESCDQWLTGQVGQQNKATLLQFETGSRRGQDRTGS